jgi:hypothetical protein
MARGKSEMKKIVLISVLILMVVFPSVVFAGNIYWKASATFNNAAGSTVPNARGSATITPTKVSDTAYKWTVTISFSGLLKNYNYIFQFGIQDQLLNVYDYPVATDKNGKISKTFVIYDLDSIFQNIQYPPVEHNPLPAYVGYTILRLLDLNGTSGGIFLSTITDPNGGLEPNNEEPNDNPYYLQYPNAKMVMRARQDGAYGSLVFSQPKK